MAAQQKKGETAFLEVLQSIKEIVAAAFTVATFSLITVVLFAIGVVLFRVIWPQPEFAIDSSVIELISVFAWPLVAALAIFFLITSKTLRHGAAQVFQRVKTMRAGDYEVSFSEAGAKRLKRDLEESLTDFCAQSEVEYTRSARTHRIRSALKAMLHELYRLSRQLELPDANGIQERNISATVHIEDVVYEESLYQLVDYVPSGGGAGRRFSIRYGAIGISYRSDDDRYWNIMDPANTAESLITSWGMTSEEASHSRQDGFALCLILKDEKEKIPGVLFLKANKISAIGGELKTDEMAKTLTDFLEKINSDAECCAKRRNLANALSAVYEDVAPSGTFIHVYK